MADEQKLKYTVEINKAGTGAAQAARELQEVSKAAEMNGKRADDANHETARDSTEDEAERQLHGRKRRHQKVDLAALHLGDGER